MTPTTFNNYLRLNLAKGITHHVIHAAFTGNDEVRFCAHAINADGQSSEFIISNSDELLPSTEEAPSLAIE